MADLVSLPVLASKPVAFRQALVLLDVSGHPELVASHTTAGQYVKAGFFADDVARPVALCNKPGALIWELLLKQPPSQEGDDRLARLQALTPADRAQVSIAQGKGFPVDAAKGRNVYLLGVGSGIAPLKSVVEVVAADRNSWGDVVLLYGVRDKNELAFQERFALWAGLSIKVLPVVSRPLDPGHGGETWKGLTGHVQDHLPQRFDHPAKVSVFVCGLPEMEKAVGQALLERGVSPDQVFRNW